ncbi:hypothetical protein FPY71_07150 [Aureimonas fodinaquatilis]|uniref:Uncharacterized protein n=1 Tax=Aureimonas fodinaquatilis TaxID=2565783 RepID=A0A5B0DU59_9HYPH|nr:hypothetical protein [Aureimonas fodinaquatilis]KAA0970294.1 hypothetical protein FPY71_07150 [Aureimonas fodinaquatilis]
MNNVTRIPQGQVSTPVSGKVSAARLLDDAFESLSSRTIMAVGPTGQTMSIPVAWPHGRSPSNDEKTELMRIVNSIHTAMQTPATEDELEDNIDLLISGRASSGKVEGGSRGRVYALVLADVPGAILKAAVTNILRGKAEGIKAEFLPTTDVMLEYCERLQRNVMAKAVMVERMLNLPELPAPEEREGDFQAMREKISKLAQTVRVA